MKHLTPILLWLLCCSSFLAYSQNDWQWIKRGGAGNNVTDHGYWFSHQEAVYDIETDADNNIYVISRVGYADPDVEGDDLNNLGGYTSSDVVVSSFGCDGSYRWSTLIGGGGTESIYGIEVDAAGNVYVAGKFGSCNANSGYPNYIGNNFSFFYYGNACTLLFMAKLDSDGNLLWFHQPQELMTSSEAFTYSAGFNMILTSNNELHWLTYLPQGSYEDGAFVNSQTGSSVYILKYDLDGNYLDAVLLPFSITASSYTQTLRLYYNEHNNQYYVTGMRGGNNTSFTINGESITQSAFIASFDSTGQWLWTRTTTYEGAGTFFFHNIAFDPVTDDIYFAFKMGGFSIDSFLGVSLADALIPSFVMKTNADASSVLWSSHSDGIPSNYGDMLVDGNTMYVTFMASQTLTWGSQSMFVSDLYNNESTEAMLATFDTSTGACTALDKIEGYPGFPDNGTALAVDQSGDLLVGGSMGYILYDAYGNAAASAGGNSDFFIAKYATSACTPLALPTVEEDELGVYPNPVGATLYITGMEGGTYQLVQLSGQLVLEGHFSSTEPIAMETVASGIYILKCTDATGRVAHTKIIKE